MQELLGWTWTDFEEVGSTNDEAKLLTYGAKGHKYIVTAKTQTNGRGRRGRNWVGLEGNLFMSLALEMPIKDMGQVIFVVSLSLLEALRSLFPSLDIKLKWPNDVLVNSRKVSGILLEKGEGEYLIIGIGVNIVAAPQIDGLVYPTISLVEADCQTDRISVLHKYIECLNANINIWQKDGFEEIRQRWLADVKSLGAEILVRTTKEDKKGTFKGVDENGILLLETAAGIEKIYAGDVFCL